MQYVPYVKENIMSKILDQLEEADHILMSRAGHVMEVKKPIPDNVQPSEKPEIKRDKLTAPSFSDDEVHKKPKHGCPDSSIRLEHVTK